MRGRLLICLLLSCATLAAQDAQRTAKFTRPRVPEALFTPAHTALLEPECERIATYLARFAARHCTEGVLKGDPRTIGRARLLLTVSLHVQPLNASAVHCSTRWLDGKSPALPPEEDNLRVFSAFLLTIANREGIKAGAGQDLLARVFRRLAADLDPENEAAVLASEVQDRDGKAPPLLNLINGAVKLGEN